MFPFGLTVACHFSLCILKLCFKWCFSEIWEVDSDLKVFSVHCSYDFILLSLPAPRWLERYICKWKVGKCGYCLFNGWLVIIILDSGWDSGEWYFHIPLILYFLIGPSILLQMASFHSFSGWIAFHSRYVPHLLLTIPLFKLFPGPDYCKECQNENRDACTFSNYGFLQIYAQKGDCWSI